MRHLQFSHLASYLDQLESISARLEITRILATLLKELGPDEIVPASYLLQGKLVPTYQSLEFQLSTKMVQRALARLVTSEMVEHQAGSSLSLFADESTAEDEQHKLEYVNHHFKKLGDLGLVAAEVVASSRVFRQPAPGSTTGPALTPLTITQVYSQLVSIAQAGGEGSQDKKLELLTELLAQLDPLGAKYAVRIVMGRWVGGRPDFDQTTGDTGWQDIGQSHHHHLQDPLHTRHHNIVHSLTAVADTLVER